MGTEVAPEQGNASIMRRGGRRPYTNSPRRTVPVMSINPCISIPRAFAPSTNLYPTCGRLRSAVSLIAINSLHDIDYPI
jgi:hypothetical protein